MDNMPDNTPPQQPLIKLVEICMVTSEYKRTIDGLSALGIGPFKIFDFTAEAVQERKWHGAPGDFTLKVGFAKVGDVTWEIMQPTGGPSLMSEYLERNGGREGIQHVAFDLGNIPMEERKKNMKAKGIEVAMEGIWMGKKGTCHFCFFDTEGLTGTLFETIEFSSDWEDPEHEWYPAPPESL